MTALALSLGVVAVLMLLLLRLGILPTRVPIERSLATFTVTPEGQQQATAVKRTTARHAAAKAAPRAAAAPTPPVTPPVPTPAPLTHMSRDEFAATDIGKMTGPKTTDGADGDDTGTDTAAVYGPGEGPGGARLYFAEWYREPPPSALALYLPGGPQPGWATIACRTRPAYHVDDCRELDESPRGSGLSRALRQAAWQFLVRPPRLGGKPLIGAWVRIRFDFSERKAG